MLKWCYRYQIQGKGKEWREIEANSCAFPACFFTLTLECTSIRIHCGLSGKIWQTREMIGGADEWDSHRWYDLEIQGCSSQVSNRYSQTMTLWAAEQRDVVLAISWKKYTNVFLNTLIDASGKFKGVTQLKMNILSTVTYSHVIPNLYDFHFSMKQKRRKSEECSRCSFSWNGSEWRLGLWSYKRGS